MFALGPESLYLLGWRGTLRRGDDVLPGAADLLRLLRRTATPFLVITNDSSTGATGHAVWARDRGLDLDAEDFLTAAALAITYLRVHHPGRSVFVVGTPELREEVARADIPLAPEGAHAEATLPVVLLGRDPDLDADAIHRGINLVRDGAPLVATHGDVLHPIAGGFEADAGAVLALLVAATGARPTVLGKPDPRLVDHALSLRAGSRRDRAVVIGCARTDLALAQRAGLTAAVVCSDAGERAARFPGARLVAADLAELTHRIGESHDQDAVIVEWQQVREGGEHYF